MNLLKIRKILRISLKKLSLRNLSKHKSSHDTFHRRQCKVIRRWWRWSTFWTNLIKSRQMIMLEHFVKWIISEKIASILITKSNCSSSGFESNNVLNRGNWQITWRCFENSRLKSIHQFLRKSSVPIENSWLTNTNVSRWICASLHNKCNKDTKKEVGILTNHTSQIWPKSRPWEPHLANETCKFHFWDWSSSEFIRTIRPLRPCEPEMACGSGCPGRAEI